MPNSDSALSSPSPTPKEDLDTIIQRALSSPNPEQLPNLVDILYHAPEKLVWEREKYLTIIEKLTHQYPLTNEEMQIPNPSQQPNKHILQAKAQLRFLYLCLMTDDVPVTLSFGKPLPRSPRNEKQQSLLLRLPKPEYPITEPGVATELLNLFIFSVECIKELFEFRQKINILSSPRRAHHILYYFLSETCEHVDDAIITSQSLTLHGIIDWYWVFRNDGFCGPTVPTENSDHRASQHYVNGILYNLVRLTQHYKGIYVRMLGSYIPRIDMVSKPLYFKACDLSYYDMRCINTVIESQLANYTGADLTGTDLERWRWNRCYYCQPDRKPKGCDSVLGKGLQYKPIVIEV